MGAVAADARQRAQPQIHARPPVELQGVPAEPPPPHPEDPEPVGLRVASAPGAAAPAPDWAGWEVLGSTGPGKL